MSDSDYSSDEGEDYTGTNSNTILGFVDTEILDEEPSIEDTFIGGQPIWLNESKPDLKLLECLNCKGRLSLLLQAFAPLDGELYDRVIYVFACGKSECNKKAGSIRAIRGICKDPVKIKELEDQEQIELKEKLDEKLKLDNKRNFLFTDNQKEEPSNPFGTNPFSKDSNPFGGNPFTSNPFNETKKQEETFASVAKNAAPIKKSNEKLVDELPTFPGFFLYTEEEKFKKIDKSKLPEGIQIDENALDLEADNVGSAKVNAEYAKIANSLTDEDFEKFSEIISHNPLQVLRYDIGGKPILYSSKDDVGLKVIKDLIPKPGFNPSSFRQFELQLMSKLLIDFEKKLKNIENGMEWVTILVYTDKEDFIPELDSNYVGYVEEWCGVQWEETPIASTTTN